MRNLPSYLTCLLLTFSMAVAAPVLAFNADEAAELDAAANQVLAQFQNDTSGEEELLANAKGILICPSITKGGLVVGVEGGRCVMRAGGSTAHYYRTRAVKVGALAGVQSYSMILVFNEDKALAKFTSTTREWEIGVDADVTVASLNAGAKLDTTNLKRDIVAFIFGEQGFMADLSIEGSNFKKIEVE